MDLYSVQDSELSKKAVLFCIAKEDGIDKIVQPVGAELPLQFQNGFSWFHPQVLLAELIGMNGLNILHPSLDLNPVVLPQDVKK